MKSGNTFLFCCHFLSHFRPLFMCVHVYVCVACTCMWIRICASLFIFSTRMYICHETANGYQDLKTRDRMRQCCSTSRHVKYFRKYIPRTLLATHVLYLFAYIYRVYILSIYHTLSYWAMKNRGSPLNASKLSSRWLTLARLAENAFPHSRSIDLHVRFGIRLAGICSRCKDSTSRRDLFVLAKRAQFRIEEAAPAAKIRRRKYRIRRWIR